MAEKIVLAYSGGLDTCVAIKWLQEERGYDVVALHIDMGTEKDFDVLQERAAAAGALKTLWVDGKETFIRHFAFPSLAAGAVYQGQYPLATALGRPLIAKLMVDVARQEGATAVAHGCTGKGNDQVRLDVGVNALAPNLKIVAPVREWNMKTREEEMVYAAKHNIPIPVTKASPYSTDDNLWGRSIECGVLEDPWNEPPDDIYEMTRSVKDAPDKPAYIEIGFERGVPVSLDGETLDGVSLVRRLNEISGEHGVGRVDLVEDRLVGIKSREIYEAPAATTLLRAHEALEHLTLSKLQLRMKARIAIEYADLIYNGLWFTGIHRDLAAFVQSSQRDVIGVVRMRLHKGQAVAVGRRSPKSLYDYSLATYDEADQYDQSAAVGFIKIWGLPVRVQAGAQLLAEGDPLHIAGPQD